MSSVIVNSDADILHKITNLRSKQQFANNLNSMFNTSSSVFATAANFFFGDGYTDMVDRLPSTKIVYFHKTNCPNCGSLLDGDENSPSVKCLSCGAKIWSEREVKV